METVIEFFHSPAILTSGALATIVVAQAVVQAIIVCSYNRNRVAEIHGWRPRRFEFRSTRAENLDAKADLVEARKKTIASRRRESEVEV